MGSKTSFNTQPPEGGCAARLGGDVVYRAVSTHSRPKAAAFGGPCEQHGVGVSTHSRPKAAAGTAPARAAHAKSFNTQPPEGGCLDFAAECLVLQVVSTHSRPKAAAAARVLARAAGEVSTHSRPKAAAFEQFLPKD